MVELLRLLGRDWSNVLTESRKAPFCPPCPRCGSPAAKHRPHEVHGHDYRCHHCGRVFNAWSGTVFEKTHRLPTKLATLLFGFLLKIPPSRFRRDLNWHKTAVRHLLKRLAYHNALARLADSGTLNGVGFNDIAKHVPASLRKNWMACVAERATSDE
jgi:transposase-like protein